MRRSPNQLLKIATRLVSLETETKYPHKSNNETKHILLISFDLADGRGQDFTIKTYNLIFVHGTAAFS